MHDRNGYCVVLTVVAPYRAALDIVMPLKRGDLPHLRAAIGQSAFDALIETPTELGGHTAALDAQALLERLNGLDARDHVSQIDAFETRRAMKNMGTVIGDDHRTVLLARYERPPAAGYAPAEEDKAISPTPFRMGG